MRADLHIHTIYSDGAYAPQEIARRAKGIGLDLISMTDHDSMEGMEEKRAAAESFGLKFVSGWEISSYAGIRKVHVLGYRCKAGSAYVQFAAQRKRGVLVRAQDMIDKANACFGMRLALTDAEEEHLKKEAPLHTMHVVRAYAKRLGREPFELYKEYFAPGKPAFSSLCQPTPEAAVEVIHASGGIAVLAHPGRIGGAEDAREKLMDILTARGLDGIECSHSHHTERETEYFKAYARAHNLLETGGSDFHKDGTERILGFPEFTPSKRLLSALGIPL